MDTATALQRRTAGLSCPITMGLLVDSVIAADGFKFTYELMISGIEEWFKKSSAPPTTGEELRHTELMPNHASRLLAATFSEACRTNDVDPNSFW